MQRSLATTMTRYSVALGIFLIGAGGSMYADMITVGQVGQNFGGSASNLLTTSLPSWSFTCSTCTGYAISANGAATATDGLLGASSSVTVTGTPGADLLVTASSDALFSDMLTITGGTGSGVLELTYALDGFISNTGTGPNSSSASLYMSTAGTDSQYDNEGISSGGYVEIDGNGTYSDTVTYYIPFTYGSALATELDLDASSLYVHESAFGSGNSTPFTATVNYYNTAALTSALVFNGTPSAPGAENNAAIIGAASGLGYGPNGISAAPEPGTWLMAASAMGVLGLATWRNGRNINNIWRSGISRENAGR